VRALLVVATLAAIGAFAGAGAQAHPSAACGGATALRGSPVLQLGSLRVAGFASNRCAQVLLGCGPKQGGYQAPLSLELSKKLAAPVVLRSSANRVTLGLVGNATPAPKVPRCLPASSAHPTAKLRVRDMYFVLFVFAPKSVTFHLSAWSGGRRVGDVAIGAVRAP
jgi:hypothetical protein